MTFTTALWRRCPDGNLVVSPWSIAAALVMAWTGARGDTAAEMQRVLGLASSDRDGVARAWGERARALRAADGVTLAIALRLFGERSYAFEHEFQARLANELAAPMEALDFAGAHEAARQHINGWVAEQTRGKIADLLAADAVNPLTRLALVNAIYFLGKWERPFPQQATSARPFWVTPAGTTAVPTMQATGPYRTGAVDGAQIVELRYTGGAVAMHVVMPDARDGLAALERRLDDAALARWQAALAWEPIVLSLPRFKLAPATLELTAALRALGMKLAFDPARADLTGMAKRVNPDDELCLSKVFHKAFVQVDEEGTVAAAATAVMAQPRGGPPEPPRQVAIDRPFLFFIADTQRGDVLFMGRVVDPTA